MSTYKVHTGFWIDRTRGNSVLGASVTLTSKLSDALIAIASLWVGNLIAGWFWSLVASAVYRSRLKTKQRDGLHMQHSLVWRNYGDPLSAATAIKDIGLERSRWWERFRLAWQRLISDIRQPGSSSQSANATNVPKPSARLAGRGFYRAGRRTACAMSLPSIIFAGFFVAGVFVSQIAYPNHDVLIARDLNACGILSYANASNPAANQYVLVSAYEAKVLGDTLNARNYAGACYSEDTINVNPVSCSYFVRQSLKYGAQNFSGHCPFQTHPDVPFAGGACDAPHNPGTFRLSTNLLDSNIDLGINAPKHHTIAFKKTVDCSVVSLVGRTDRLTGVGGQANASWTVYRFGTVGSVGGGGGLGDNVTFFINPAASSDSSMSYQVQAVYALSGATAQAWTPAVPFHILDGDVSLYFLVSNSVVYETPVLDPYFWATNPFREPLGFKKASTVFVPINPVSVLGCIDRYSICESSNANAKCTPLDGILALPANIKQLNLNLAQHVTALRVTNILQSTDTQSSVYGTGAEALKASTIVFDEFSPGLPSNQWQIEVEGWFQTSLAKMQAYAVEFANNKLRHGPLAGKEFPSANASTLPIWQEQCASQRIANPAQYRTFSFFVLLFLFLFGLALRILKYFVDGFESKSGDPQYAGDDLFYLHQLALDAPLVSAEDDFPVQDPAYIAPTLQKVNGFFRYHHTQTGNAQTGNTQTGNAQTGGVATNILQPAAAQATSNPTTSASPNPTTTANAVPTTLPVTVASVPASTTANVASTTMSTNPASATTAPMNTLSSNTNATNATASINTPTTSQTGNSPLNAAQTLRPPPNATSSSNVVPSAAGATMPTSPPQTTARPYFGPTSSASAGHNTPATAPNATQTVGITAVGSTP